MKKNARLLSAVYGLMILGALPCSAAAGTPAARPPTGQAATAADITNAQAFLGNEAKTSLGFMHAGCSLKGVNAKTVTRHPDGTFTVSVRYDWSGLDNGNDFTEVHCKFNARGRLTGLQVGDSSAILFPPYSVADLGLGLLRDALLQDLRRLPADDPLRLAIEPRVRGANARTLHLLILKLRQPR